MTGYVGKITKMLPRPNVVVNISVGMTNKSNVAQIPVSTCNCFVVSYATDARNSSSSDQPFMAH